MVAVFTYRDEQVKCKQDSVLGVMGELSCHNQVTLNVSKSVSPGVMSSAAAFGGSR